MHASRRRGLLVAVACLFGLPLAAACFFSLPLAGKQAKQPGDEAKEPDEGSSEAGHSLHGAVFDEGPRQRAYLMGGTGSVSLKITTKSPEAQQFFDQGLGQLHGFWYFEAERSFRQAAAIDPDCAMAYWGMAMANRENGKRSRCFIAEAVKRKAAATPYEAAWIDALEHHFAPGPDGQPQDDRQRRRQLVRALEEIVHEHPEEIEAKAFLALLIWENSGYGIPIANYEAVAELLREVHAVSPMHPAHHYVIHLWDNDNAARALPSAAVCGPSAPSIAHMWHMPAHMYSKLERYADAVWCAEAAARVDHAHALHDRVMPDQIDNYSHNGEWLVENLTFIGRVRDAVDEAAHLAELPRHPKYNSMTSGSGTSKLGRRRLLAILPQFELWDDLLRLAQTASLEPSDVEGYSVRRHGALGAALIAKGKLTEAKRHIVALQDLRSKVQAEQAQARGEAAGRFQGRLAVIAAALNELQGRWALASNDVPAALAHFAKAKDLTKEFRSRVELRAGNKAKAEQLAREAVQVGKNHVLPLANCVEVLYACGKSGKAAEEFRKLQAISAFIDRDVPIFKRLDELAPKLGLPSEWRMPYQPSGDLGERPDLASFGPARWRPSPAPEWTLPDDRGESVSLAQYRGRPLVLIFYLGFGCLHCVEQLNAFAPRQAEFARLDIDLVAIGTDEVDVLRASLEARAAAGQPPLPIKLLSDAGLSVFKSYRAYDDFEDLPLHATFLIDKKGLVRWQDISAEPFTDATFLLDEAQRLLRLPSATGEPRSAGTNF
ncbi:MAG TPA: peroxiredoxin family protein [Pirellulales bacterium]|nr:peroxiredoxin family protein [Pirellulales bacterium]